MAQADGRFAPSPTGPLHLGNLRTALLAWLHARSGGGRFLLRIDDLDRERCRPEHERHQIRDLQTLGLDWDVEPPPRQSLRTDAYAAALEQLKAEGRIYRCWCSRREIRLAASAPHGFQPAYPGTCRGAAPRDGPYAWRLDVRGMRTRFSDLAHGQQEGAPDDFVLWRSDGTPAYNLAVVIDDAEQAIGEVVRGDDLLPSTHRQVALQELLGLPRPRYRHVPLLLGSGGDRLAKRDGAITLGERGETPERLIGWMAWSVGLAPAGAALTIDELLAGFDSSAQLRPQPAPLLAL